MSTASHPPSEGRLSLALSWNLATDGWMNGDQVSVSLRVPQVGSGLQTWPRHTHTSQGWTTNVPTFKSTLFKHRLPRSRLALVGMETRSHAPSVIFVRKFNLLLSSFEA